VTGIECRTKPFVMGLVQIFVKEWYVQPPVYPVNAIVSEE